MNTHGAALLGSGSCAGAERAAVPRPCLQVGEKDQIFGSVTPAEVVEAIELQTGRQLDKKVCCTFLLFQIHWILSPV